MQFVRIHHAVEQLTVAVRQFIVDIQEANLFAISQFGQIFVDSVNDRHDRGVIVPRKNRGQNDCRSEEHTSELQSHSDLVCRLLLEKKKKKKKYIREKKKT